MAIQSALALGMGGAEHAVARWPRTVFVFGAMMCLSVSAAAHLLASHLRHFNRLFWQLNYAGYGELFSRYIDDPNFQFWYENDTPHIKARCIEVAQLRRLPLDCPAAAGDTVWHRHGELLSLLCSVPPVPGCSDDPRDLRPTVMVWVYGHRYMAVWFFWVDASRVKTGI
ncbi:heptahelical transmembrane protein ADIPOR2-like [Hordeum vulgare]|nr:heptahelical transmembrane protein ADIPOR2-like [Hordeum vulgare]